jgi:tetratricopeptide (TPR) repeat protein
MNRESIEKYQNILRKDPNSQVFAALADAYRELGLLEQAEQVAKDGVRRHPSYVSGFVALGRVLVAKENWREAEQVLLKATSLAPENILAHQLSAQVYLQQNRPKEALKAYKMVLFLNPQSKTAKAAVEKLESLTADEYENEVFEMKKLKVDDRVPGPSTLNTVPSQLERTLSLVDAFIARNEIEKAKTLIKEAQNKFPGEEKLQARWDMLGEEEPFEEATEILPQISREKLIINRKIKRLEFVLQRIKTIQI